MDDEPDGAEALARLLEMEGCTTLVATSAPDALAKIEDFTPLCVLLDLNMPNMTGTELAAALRAKYEADVILIAITGYDSESAQARSARDEGVDYVMTKPVDVQRLLQILGIRP
ncbi:MAG: response regulator [Pseudomonadota bacterium]